MSAREFSDAGDAASNAATLLAMLRDAPAHEFAPNLRTHVELLQGGAYAFPTTVTHGESGNAWICSPLTTYCDYAADEALRHFPAWLAAPVWAACRLMGKVLRWARIDHTVAANNWLVSTNLYPPLDAAALDEVIATALRRWPRHAVWFRSLNAMQNPDWLAALRQRGFLLIPSRQVYLFEALSSTQRQPSDLRRDLKLLHGTPLQRVASASFSQCDYARVAELYAALYLEKYSRFNPQYTAVFMQRWHQAGLLALHGFRDAAGELQAVVGLFSQGGTLTAPIVGYNTALPQSLGLYRLLMATVFDEAMRTNLVVNLSAGASQFKRQRGGRAEIEYSAVLVRHLHFKTRIALAGLRWLAAYAGVPLMKRYRL
jgi:hypothetical protein